MQHPDAKPSPKSDASCGASCECPPANDNCAPSLPPRGFLRRIFKKSCLCAGSGASGFLIGHAGCVITPLVIAAAGLTTATAGVSILALAFGAAATAGGLYAWHRLRGGAASRFEKRLVVGSALSGLLISGAMMHFNGHDHHGGHIHPAPHPAEQTDPAPGHHHHHSHRGSHGSPAGDLSPAAAAWLENLAPQKRREIEAMAKATRMSLGEYLDGMCGLPPAPARVAAEGKAGPRL